MAELSDSGTYVKFIAHAWMDRTTGAIKVNSADKEIKSLGGIHFTAKKGSKTRECLIELLENHGCGPSSLTKKIDPMAEISDALDQAVYLTETGKDPKAIKAAMETLKEKLAVVLPPLEEK